jgi:hypothetical protein
MVETRSSKLRASQRSALNTPTSVSKNDYDTETSTIKLFQHRNPNVTPPVEPQANEQATSTVESASSMPPPTSSLHEVPAPNSRGGTNYSLPKKPRNQANEALRDDKAYLAEAPPVRSGGKHDKRNYGFANTAQSSLASHADSATRSNDELATDNTKPTAMTNSTYWQNPAQPSRQAASYSLYVPATQYLATDTYPNYSSKPWQGVQEYENSTYLQTTIAATTTPYTPYFGQVTTAENASSYASGYLSAVLGRQMYLLSYPGGPSKSDLDRHSSAISRSLSSEDADTAIPSMYVNDINRSQLLHLIYELPSYDWLPVRLTRSAK